MLGEPCSRLCGDVPDAVALTRYTQIMQLIVPHLFPSARLLETAARDLRLPAFETLLARGRLVPCPAEGVEAQVCAALGISRQQDYPVAPITLQYDGGEAGTHYWLRADPVHMRVMRDRIVLADSGTLGLSQPEAKALARSIHSHFAATFHPQPLHPTRWYLRLDQVPRLRTTPLSVAVGCDIDPLLPQGEDAMRYRSELNELQMLLFEHPVNQAREARGDLPVNSLWLWGGGCLSTVPKKRIQIYGNEDEVIALGRYCDVEVAARPSLFSAMLPEQNKLVVLDQLKDAGQYGDVFGWREAITALDRDWFAPLLQHLRWHPSAVQLTDPVNGQTLEITELDPWRVWRRPRALV